MTFGTSIRSARSAGQVPPAADGFHQSRGVPGRFHVPVGRSHRSRLGAAIHCTAATLLPAGYSPATLGGSRWAWRTYDRRPRRARDQRLLTVCTAGPATTKSGRTLGGGHGTAMPGFVPLSAAGPVSGRAGVLRRPGSGGPAGW